MALDVVGEIRDACRLILNNLRKVRQRLAFIAVRIVQVVCRALERRMRPVGWTTNC
jgi:hypothetical protein